MSRRGANLEIYRLPPVPHPTTTTSSAPRPPLECLLTLNLYGTIQCLIRQRSPGHTTDRLLVLTESFHYTLLAWDPATASASTISCGDLSESFGLFADNGALAAVDPTGRFVALHLYANVVKLMTLPTAPNEAPTLLSYRIEQPNVLDMCFLHVRDGCAPVLALLYENVQEHRFLTTYTIVPRSGLGVEAGGAGAGAGAFDPLGMFLEPQHAPRDVEAGASAVAPVPLPQGGVLVLGEATAHYITQPRREDEPGPAAGSGTGTGTGSGGNNPTSGTIDPGFPVDHYEVAHPLPPAVLRVWDQITDGSDDTVRYLIGSDHGGLCFLTIATWTDGSPTLAVRNLGPVPPPCSLAYLGDGRCFVGSMATDAALVMIHDHPVPRPASRPGPDNEPNYIETLTTQTHLGPIQDFVVVDPDRVGQEQMVACAGLGSFGSLKIIRSGMSVREHAGAEMEGVRGLWSLPGVSRSESGGVGTGDGVGVGHHPSPPPQPQTRLLVSFVEQTRALATGASGPAASKASVIGAIGEQSLPPTIASRPTLAAGGVLNGTRALIVQRDGLSLMTADGVLVARWSPGEGQPARGRGGGGLDDVPGRRRAARLDFIVGSDRGAELRPAAHRRARARRRHDAYGRRGASDARRGRLPPVVSLGRSRWG